MSNSIARFGAPFSAVQLGRRAEFPQPVLPHFLRPGFGDGNLCSYGVLLNVFTVNLATHGPDAGPKQGGMRCATSCAPCNLSKGVKLIEEWRP